MVVKTVSNVDTIPAEEVYVMAERTYEELETVGELIEALKEFDPNSPFKVTWEGQIHSLFKDNLYLSYNNYLIIDEECRE